MDDLRQCETAFSWSEDNLLTSGNIKENTLKKDQFLKHKVAAKPPLAPRFNKFLDYTNNDSSQYLSSEISIADNMSEND